MKQAVRSRHERNLSHIVVLAVLFSFSFSLPLVKWSVLSLLTVSRIVTVSFVSFSDRFLAVGCIFEGLCFRPLSPISLFPLLALSIPFLLLLFLIFVVVVVVDLCHRCSPACSVHSLFRPSFTFVRFGMCIYRC